MNKLLTNFNFRNSKMLFRSKRNVFDYFGDFFKKYQRNYHHDDDDHHNYNHHHHRNHHHRKSHSDHGFNKPHYRPYKPNESLNSGGSSVSSFVER